MTSSSSSSERGKLLISTIAGGKGTASAIVRGILRELVTVWGCSGVCGLRGDGCVQRKNSMLTRSCDRA